MPGKSVPRHRLLPIERELISALQQASQPLKLILQLLNLIRWFSAKPWSHNKYFTARELLFFFFCTLRAKSQHSSDQEGENLIANCFFHLFVHLWDSHLQLNEGHRYPLQEQEFVTQTANWDATCIPLSQLQEQTSGLQVSSSLQQRCRWRAEGSISPRTSS